jgi:hypothetical protein
MDIVHSQLATDPLRLGEIDSPGKTESRGIRRRETLLRLRLSSGLSQRVVGESVGLSQGAVCHYLNRAQRAGLSWPLPDGLDDQALEALLFPPPPDIPPDRRPKPDLAWVHRELRRPNVTLACSGRSTERQRPTG